MISVCLITGDVSSFLFLLLSSIRSYENPSLLLHFSVNGYLVYFLLLALMNNAVDI